jgi:hypothetical protein
VNGVALIYVRVYKSGNEVMCDSLRTVDDRSYPLALRFLSVGGSAAPADPANPLGTSSSAADRVHHALSHGDRSRAIVFTVVREPIQHFVAGFSELNLFKSRKTASGASLPATTLGQLRDFQSTPAYAERFIRRVVAGGLNLSRVLNMHVLPQVAFLSRRAPRSAGRSCCDGEVDLIGSLENLAETWRALGERAQRLQQPQLVAPREPRARSGSGGEGLSGTRTAAAAAAASWPPLSGRNAHPVTNASAGFSPRLSMEALLRSSPALTVALCRLLLPDYVCFDFVLPPACARVLGEKHGVECALTHVPRRIG